MSHFIISKLSNIEQAIRNEGFLPYVRRIQNLGVYRHYLRKAMNKDKLKSPTAEVMGYQLQLPKRTEGITEELILYGVHEPFSTEVYGNYLVEGDVIFDVGSNLGYYLTVAQQVLKGQCTIVGFEPDPELYELSCLNAGTLAGSISVNNLAAADTSGSLTFYRSDVANWGTLIPQDGLKLSEEVEVQATTLDDYVQSAGISPTVLRMDIEGGEILALRGARQCLQQVRMLYLELHCAFLNDAELDEIFGILQACGFEHASWLDRYYDWPWSKRSAQAASYTEGSLQQLQAFSHNEDNRVLSTFIFSSTHTH